MYVYIYIYTHTYIYTYIHYITLHYITLHYITLHYITLHTYNCLNPTYRFKPRNWAPPSERHQHNIVAVTSSPIVDHTHT